MAHGPFPRVSPGSTDSEGLPSPCRWGEGWSAGGVASTMSKPHTQPQIDPLVPFPPPSTVVGVGVDPVTSVLGGSRPGNQHGVRPQDGVPPPSGPPELPHRVRSTVRRDLSVDPCVDPPLGPRLCRAPVVHPLSTPSPSPCATGGPRPHISALGRGVTDHDRVGGGPQRSWKGQHRRGRTRTAPSHPQLGKGTSGHGHPFPLRGHSSSDRRDGPLRSTTRWASPSSGT